MVQVSVIFKFSLCVCTEKIWLLPITARNGVYHISVQKSRSRVMVIKQVTWGQSSVHFHASGRWRLWKLPQYCCKVSVRSDRQSQSLRVRKAGGRAGAGLHSAQLRGSGCSQFPLPSCTKSTTLALQACGWSGAWFLPGKENKNKVIVTDWSFSFSLQLTYELFKPDRGDAFNRAFIRVWILGH